LCLTRIPIKDYITKRKGGSLQVVIRVGASGIPILGTGYTLQTTQMGGEVIRDGASAIPILGTGYTLQTTQVGGEVIRDGATATY